MTQTRAQVRHVRAAAPLPPSGPDDSSADVDNTEYSPLSLTPEPEPTEWCHGQVS